MIATVLRQWVTATALIALRYWTLPDADRVDSMEGFYKNLCVVGRFLLLYITGAGRYSIDAILGL